MTEAQALTALAREDPEAADEAKAALGWLTNGEGLETVSQLKLQEFVWYALPVKWPMTTGELIAVTRRWPPVRHGRHGALRRRVHVLQHRDDPHRLRPRP